MNMCDLWRVFRGSKPLGLDYCRGAGRTPLRSEHDGQHQAMGAEALQQAWGLGRDVSGRKLLGYFLMVFSREGGAETGFPFCGTDEVWRPGEGPVSGARPSVP